MHNCFSSYQNPLPQSCSAQPKRTTRNHQSLKCLIQLVQRKGRKFIRILKLQYLNFRIVKVPEKQQMMHLGMYLERSSLVGLDAMVDRRRQTLKKDEEITKLKQKHANEITSLKEEMKEMMREEIRYFFSQLVKNNPGLDFHEIQECVGSNIPSPVDASSARAMRGHNLPYSSGSTHAPSLEKENTGDAIGNGGYKSI